MKITCDTLEKLPEAAAQIASEIGDDARVVLLTGDLGAGKTTLVKELCKVLGSRDEPSSPTFSLVNEYLTDTAVIYHIDLYRLQTLQEAYDIGIEEYLYSGNWCFVEWPQLIQTAIEPPFVHLQIAVDDGDTRNFRILKYTT